MPEILNQQIRLQEYRVQSLKLRKHLMHTHPAVTRLRSLLTYAGKVPAERAGKDKQTAKLAKSPGTLQNTDSVQGKAISHKGEAPKDEGLADELL